MKPPINTNQNAERIAQRLRAMFGMYEVGIDMFRCRLRREHPDATPRQINHRIAEYLRADRHDPAVFKKRSCSRFSAPS